MIALIFILLLFIYDNYQPQCTGCHMEGWSRSYSYRFWGETCGALLCQRIFLGFWHLCKQANDDYKNTHILAEVQTTSISTGVVARDNHLRSPDFFNVEVFPLMTFKSTKIKMEKTRKGKIYGDLTLHGVTQRIELEVLLIGKRKSPVSKKTQ